MSRRFDWIAWLIGGAITLTVLAIIVVPTVYVLALRGSAHYETFKVEDRQRGADKTPYLVYTDHGTKSVEDSTSFWTFNSSDRWAALKVGHTYRCKVAGWRIPILSAYPNVIGPCSEAKVD